MQIRIQVYTKYTVYMQITKIGNFDIFEFSLFSLWRTGSLQEYINKWLLSLIFFNCLLLTNAESFLDPSLLSARLGDFGKRVG
jgi:hypothetical protein